ncbi:FHA domain-containing protein [Collinsella tanakaei]|uniref:FHA domain-containing protein n=1 Tax=Collinsella tanakaei TaxID=626935 RepID=UPI0025A44CB6|nr:FHA domain-containing protein [Collinsella tanakaei]MDM8302488.1 FHA domain-containing protein [Collinsella tanakaei]
MPLTIAADQTPCGVLFDVFKRQGGISHKELASLILSERPLADGRSPVNRASDRTWLSHFVVRAPIGSLQPRYFKDHGLAAQRVLSRLRSRVGFTMTYEKVIDLICGEVGEAMDRALSLCHQDVALYRNALTRYKLGSGYTTGERAEALMVLFVAVGCSANVPYAVRYTTEYVERSFGGRAGTPESSSFEAVAAAPNAVPASHALGLMRMADGYLTGAPHWISAASEGVRIGALACGEDDITDVEADVSAEHALVWWDAESACWKVRDLESTNGTRVVRASDGTCVELTPDEDAELRAGDELRLGASTAFVVLEGISG